MGYVDVVSLRVRAHCKRGIPTPRYSRLTRLSKRSPPMSGGDGLPRDLEVRTTNAEVHGAEAGLTSSSQPVNNTPNCRGPNGIRTRE